MLDISVSKSNQTMKRGNLVEYNMKNHVPNMAQKLVLDPFLKKLK